MTWVAAAIAGSAALGYLGSQNAADAQESAAAGGRALTERMYNQNRADLAPWRTGGASANQNLLGLLGINNVDREQFRTKLLRPATAGTPQQGWYGDRAGGYRAATPGSPAEYGIDEEAYQAALARTSGPGFGSLMQNFTGADLQNEPGYQFGLDEGLQGIEQMGRARGMSDSGATMKALLRYNQDYAGTKFNDAFNRNMANRNSIYSMLSGVSNTGANAAGQTAQLGANSANMGANLLMQGGDARASGIVGGANAINQGLGTWLNYRGNQDWLKAINRGGSV